jgi:hypothetical protein
MSQAVASDNQVDARLLTAAAKPQPVPIPMLARMKNAKPAHPRRGW